MFSQSASSPGKARSPNPVEFSRQKSSRNIEEEASERSQTDKQRREGGKRLQEIGFFLERREALQPIIVEASSALSQYRITQYFISTPTH